MKTFDCTKFTKHFFNCLADHRSNLFDAGGAFTVSQKLRHRHERESDGLFDVPAILPDERVRTQPRLESAGRAITGGGIDAR